MVLKKQRNFTTLVVKWLNCKVSIFTCRYNFHTCRYFNNHYQLGSKLLKAVTLSRKYRIQYLIILTENNLVNKQQIEISHDASQMKKNPPLETVLIIWPRDFCTSSVSAAAVLTIEIFVCQGGRNNLKCKCSKNIQRKEWPGRRS